MAVNQLLVQTYCTNIYLTGRTKFESIKEEYHDPVKLRAAQTYYIDDIERAAANGWITEQQKQETLDLKTENDPQYRPLSAAPQV